MINFSFYLLVIQISFPNKRLRSIILPSYTNCAQKHINYQHYFMKRLANYNNVRIYGFYACDFINNLANYYKITSHYHLH